MTANLLIYALIFLDLTDLHLTTFCLFHCGKLAHFSLDLFLSI